MGGAATLAQAKKDSYGVFAEFSLPVFSCGRFWLAGSLPGCFRGPFSVERAQFGDHFVELGHHQPVLAGLRLRARSRSWTSGVPEVTTHSFRKDGCDTGR